MSDEQKQFVIARLLAAPREIADRESLLQQSIEVREHRKATLQQEEDRIILRPAEAEDALRGKNAEQRAAELRRRTELERLAVESAERQVAYDRIALNRAHNDFAALRAVARIYGGTD